jgi:hypothetical protein
MLAFIDEVGDNGLKFDKNSSHYFTVAMVMFYDEKKAEEYIKTIEQLKQSL